MNFTVKREALIGPLQLVAGVVERRHTLPILANVLLVLSDQTQTLSLTGTDLEVEIIGRLQVELVNEPGEITIPARKLLDICRSLPDAALLDFILDDQRITIKSGRSRFTLSTLPSNDFPATEISVVNIEFNSSQTLIKRLLDATSFAMAQQDVRFYLNGLLWELEQNRLRCVATDGHRLAMSTRELDIQTPVKTQAILPRKGVIELARFLKEDGGSLKITLSSNHMRFETEEFTMTSKLIDGKFPDYERVLPEVSSNVLIGNRDELKQAFARTAILSNEKYHGVRLTLGDGSLTIVANNPEQEEAEEEVAVDYSGDSIEIGFNVTYLQDVTMVLNSENIKMTLSDSNSSALLEEPEGGDSVYVIMPMRL